MTRRIFTHRCEYVDGWDNAHEVEVRFTVTPPEPAVLAPNDRAYPGAPAMVDEIISVTMDCKDVSPETEDKILSQISERDMLASAEQVPA